MAEATIEVTAHYDPNVSVTEKDTNATGSGTSFSGSASESGATTDKTVPVKGGTDQTMKRKDKPREPKDLKFRDAEISCLLVCTEGDKTRQHSLRMKGNVSVSARVEGECIVITAVTTHDDTTTTRTRRICCNVEEDPKSDD